MGRENELRQLDTACLAARQGRGALVVVTGDAGMGKSRLCEEVAERAEQAGIRVVAARCWVDSGAPWLWPWQPLLAELCGPDTAELLASETGASTVDADRFARFVAVTDRIATACALSPVCVIIDDIHAADAGTLLLVRFLARSLRRMPLVLLVTARTGQPAPGSPEARLLEELMVEARPLRLRRFDLDETLAFLACHGLPDLDTDLSLALFRLTGGHPLVLRRIAASGPPEPGQALPSGVYMAIDDGLAGLSPHTLQMLRRAAVLGLSPSVAETAALTETDPRAVLAAVDEAAAAGLVDPDSPSRFTFTHELVRATLERGLDAASRLDTHARAAVVVSIGGAASPHGQTRRAHHAQAAAPRSTADARVAVTACRDAARAMVGHHAYAEAEALLSAAMRVHEPSRLGPPPGDLVLEWAQSALRCGRTTDARSRFHHAATSLRLDGDPALFAEAALGLGGLWVNEHRAPADRAHVLGLQREALAGLPDSEPALRCRLRARLAAEAVFDGRSVEPVYAALDAAGGCGDPVALAEVLSVAHHALFTPEHTRTRLELAEELIGVASRAGDGVLTLMGLCWRTADLFHLGDDRAVRALEELRGRATALTNENIQWVVDVMDAMLLVRDGRLGEAEAAARRCYERGAAAGEVDALGYLGAQTIYIGWLQDRGAEVLEQARQVAASPTLNQAEFSLRAGAAVLLARAGHRDQARAVLDRLGSRGLDVLPRSSTWSMGMVALVELADELEDATIARQAYDLLLPHADLPVIAALGAVCAGSTERSLGLAALTFGDPERAVGHLERAVAANRRLGNSPMAAIAQAELARALRLRNRPGDVSRARDALRRAISAAENTEMTSRAAAWRTELVRLDSINHDDRPQNRSRQGVIHREHGRWVIGIDDVRVHVPDLVGMHYMATLLLRPGVPIMALTLAGHGAVRDDASRQELLDETARGHYEAQARQLLTRLEEAESIGDIDLAERLRADIDALADQIEAATGLGRRPRAFAHPAELARTSVRKAIKRAIDTVDKAGPVVAQVLRSCIDTGYACTYTPDPLAPVTWTARVGASPAGGRGDAAMASAGIGGVGR